jgi:hypothetical protein
MKPELQVQHTDRGFAYYEFTDGYNEACTVQKSSSAMDQFIWLGTKDFTIKGFTPYGQPPWKTISQDHLKSVFGFQDVIANNRMHLSRKQVKQLLPILQKFVDTGEIE